MKASYRGYDIDVHREQRRAKAAARRNQLSLLT